jgi:hypothetical protein
VTEPSSLVAMRQSYDAVAVDDAEMLSAELPLDRMPTSRHADLWMSPDCPQLL